MRKLIFLASAVLALALAVPAFAGHNTYYRIKGGSATVDVSAAKKLKDEYGIDVSRKIGPLALKRGGSVYQSSNSMSADFSAGSKIKVKYDTRGDDGGVGSVTVVTLKSLSLYIGKKNSFVIGKYKGKELRVFNIKGGKVKKSSGKYAYKFSSQNITFNSALTNLLNKLGTPMGNKKASAKVDLGGISVKVK